MQVFSFNNNPAPVSISGHNTPDTELRETLIGASRWADTARQLVAVHASHENTVILEGEPGTGKKHLARLIHRLSPRHEGPFVVLSLGSIGNDVARGVLLGSNYSSLNEPVGSGGLPELAQGGTLYIEGLSKTSPELNDDIIRLNHKRFTAGEHEQHVRILLGIGVETDRSRSANRAFAGIDYERFRIPPLRERADDIEPLAEYFLREFCQRFGREPRNMSPEAMSALHAYDWPRNLSELKTLVIQLVRQASPPSIEVQDLPSYLTDSLDKVFLPVSGIDLEEEVKRIEVDLIRAALKQSRGYQNKAAQLLRLKPTTLFMKIRRYGIDVEGFRRAS